MRGKRYALLFSLVLCAVFALPCYADEWEVLLPFESVDIPETATPSSAVYYEDDEDLELEWEDEVFLINDLDDAEHDTATASNALLLDITPYATYYSPYDGTVSTSVVAYMEDVLPKLGNVHYVLFRSGQYTYRMVYADDMDLQSQVFVADDADYISYSTRDYTWSFGSEGSFRLDAGNYLVYSDLGQYPALDSEGIYHWVLIFAFVVFFLFVIYRSIFSAGRQVL